MQTIQLDIKDDKLQLFLTIIHSLRDDIIENIRIKNDILDIEMVEKHSGDYYDIQDIKAKNNKKYNIDDAKTSIRYLMDLKIDDKAVKDLSKLDKALATQIFLGIEKLIDFPQNANIKKLTNFYPPYRLRVGDYRVLFDVENDTITVYSVRHRKEVYKK